MADSRSVYCSWCAAEPDMPCTEWERPIGTQHREREAHFQNVRTAILREAEQSND